MKTFFKSMAAAFSMYSKIPAPQPAWDEKSLRFSLVFFPLVGVVIGGVIYILFSIFHEFALSAVFFAAAAIFATVCITGGIHLDGYCDTADALCSHGPKEEKLRILKDPHAGAFAVIYTVTLFMVQLGAWSQVFISGRVIYMVLLTFILSRSLAAFAVVSWSRARDTGLASTFAGFAARRAVRFMLGFYIILCVSAMLYLYAPAAAAVISAVFLSYAWFYSLVKRNFGGITGDLAGFYIVVCETAVLATAAVIGGIMG